MEQFIYVIDNIFEGPIELLLFLVKEKKVDISEIPLFFIINQYFNFIKAFTQFPIEITGNFISITSELLNIKSKILIKSEDDSNNFFDENFEKLNVPIAEKVLEYKSLKDAFEKLSSDEEKDIIPIFSKKSAEIIQDDEEKWESISVIDLFKHFEQIISKIPKQKDFIISRTYITVDEMIVKIKDLLNNCDFLLFSNIAEKYNSRIEFICLFLALLELVKSKYIRISQIDHFKDIKISKI